MKQKSIKKVVSWTYLLLLGTISPVLFTPILAYEKGNSMISEKVQAIVLAAGKSTRFKTGKSKLVEPICGQEMILYTTKLLARLHIPTTLVVGYQREMIIQAVEQAHPETVQFITQEEQKGTGHALICTQKNWHREHILILNGDMPLVNQEIIEELYQTHIDQNADMSFVTAHCDETNHAYGRVIKKGNITAIVEAKDFNLDPHEHCCINAGIYMAKRSFLESSIASLTRNEKSQEFYITDLVQIASNKGLQVATVSAPFDRIRGINTLQELWAAEQIKRAEIIKDWMDQGVRFSVAQNVHIDLDVTIGAGSYIGCGSHLVKGTRIGKNNKINENVSLESAQLGDNNVLLPNTIITDSSIGDDCQIGPFAHIREHCVIGNRCTIGNFVELKECTIADGTKAKHLSYLGNATVGSHVNIGAGTITCNHNGVSKNKTIIEDDAYIGSNNTLVAPITIGAQAFTAAGSVITNDVPAAALAIGRSRQINKEGYAAKLRGLNISENTSALDASKEDDLRFSGAIKTNNDSTADIL